MRLPVNTVIHSHTTLVGLEPATFVTIIKFVFRQPETVVRLYMSRDHSINSNLILTDVGRRPAHAYEIKLKLSGPRDLRHANFQGKLFVRLLGISDTKQCTKFEVSSSSSFRDIAL